MIEVCVDMDDLLVICVHGKSTKGEENMDRMVSECRELGLNVSAFKYAPVNTLSVLWRRRRIARQLINRVYSHDGPVAIVGHSAGCLFIIDSMRLGAMYEAVVFFSAAVEKDVIFPPNMKRLLNITHPYDKALFFGSLIPWHPFGLLGREGHRGYYESRMIEEQSTAEVGKYNHTAPYFSPKHVKYWAQRVKQWVIRAT